MMPKHTVIIGSPIDYEELVAYVHMNNVETDAFAEEQAEDGSASLYSRSNIIRRGRLVAIISREAGPDAVKIELFGSSNDREINKTFDFDYFVEAIQQAKKSLLHGNQAAL